jgi:hypothetical protein
MTQQMLPDTGQQQPRRTRRGRTAAIAAFVCLVGLVIGLMIGQTIAQEKTRTITRDRPVPGPTVTQTVPAPPPSAGTEIGSWSGTGNQNTPAFNASANGNYVVSWTYSGNVDPSIGGGSNFIISATDGSAMAEGLPNAIAASGSGSTEVTGASGTESFNVQATGSWTITVKTAP